MIYADNAATTKVDEYAYEKMYPFIMDEFGNASQLYSLAKKPRMALDEARGIIAKCISAEPNEIFFTSGGTESDNWVIKSILWRQTEKKRIVTSKFEHHAILNACAAIEKMDYPVTYIKPTNEGYVLPSALENVLNDQVALVSIMYANNEIGTIQPIKSLCKTAHRAGALFHTDAVQAIGHEDINVKDLDIDFLSASGHKFNAMKGTGFLYIKSGSQIEPYQNGGMQERGMRAGTENVAGIICMAYALKRNCEALEQNREHIKDLENIILHGLNEKKIAYKRNGGKEVLPGLLSLSFPDADGEAILRRMDLMGICISTGSACNSKAVETSHVLEAISLPEKYALGTIRISLGKNNTEEEAVEIVEAINKIISG
ncbi:MAG: cysteine desulfurase [Lachnospiraceae bacterium]|nr:cysteine desulfurase [Lachnospiraceae bacterium]